MPQRGATLAIVLVLVLLIAIVGMAGLRTGRLGLLLAGNVQSREQAFQLGQAALDRRLAAYQAEPTALATAPDCPAAGAAAVVAETTGAIDGIAGSYSTRLCFRGAEALAITGSSVGRFVTARFELQADARLATRGARAVLVQGFELLQPAGPE